MTPYIQPSDYAIYGIDNATDAQVATACALVDAQLGRPDGLLWSPDANGAPAYMTNKSPTASYSGITVPSGTGVVVTLPYGVFGYQNIGDVVILDRTGQCEACVVTTASANTITLAKVQNAHSGVTLEFGLTLLYEASGRTRLPILPVANILCAYGRYNYSRELGRLSGGYDDYDALLVTNYGTSGVSGWSPLDTTLWDINNTSGSIRMPCNGPETVRMRYVAGWSYTTLPNGIRQAVANLVIAAISLGAEGLTGNIKMLKAGDSTIERFSGAGGGSSLFDSSTLSLLAPYRSIRI